MFISQHFHHQNLHMHIENCVYISTLIIYLLIIRISLDKTYRTLFLVGYSNN